MSPIFSTNLLYNLTLYSTALAGAFFAALWMSLVFWTYRDIRSRSRDRMVQIASAVMVGILFIPGLLIYMVLRPSDTLDHLYFNALEEEALLSSIENHRNCPGCGARTDPEWNYCPLCYTRLSKVCGTCSRHMDLSWQLCPFCGASIPGARVIIKSPPSASEDNDQANLPAENGTDTVDN